MSEKEKQAVESLIYNADRHLRDIENIFIGAIAASSKRDLKTALDEVRKIISINPHLK